MKQTRWWVSEDSETKKQADNGSCRPSRKNYFRGEDERDPAGRQDMKWKEKKRQRDEDNEEERRSGGRPAAAAEDHEMQGASTKRVIYNRCQGTIAVVSEMFRLQTAAFFPNCLIGWLASFYFR